MSTLTAHHLREVLTYNSETGVFTRCRKGKVGSITAKGYLVIGIDGKSYFAHRLAWLYITGEFPSDQIDHINGLRLDNRLVNLREATHTINQQNTHKARKDNSTGYLGVSYQQRTSKYRAQIRLDGRKITIGEFTDPLQAHQAYLVKKRQIHIGNTL